MNNKYTAIFFVQVPQEAVLVDDAAAADELEDLALDSQVPDRPVHRDPDRLAARLHRPPLLLPLLTTKVQRKSHIVTKTTKNCISKKKKP